MFLRRNQSLSLVLDIFSGLFFSTELRLFFAGLQTKQLKLLNNYHPACADSTQMCVLSVRASTLGFHCEVSGQKCPNQTAAVCESQVNVLTSCLSRSCCVGWQHLKLEICCSVWRAWFTRSQSRVKRTVRHTQWNMKVNTHRSASHTCVGACWHQKVRLHFRALQSNKSPVKKKKASDVQGFEFESFCVWFFCHIGPLISRLPLVNKHTLSQSSLWLCQEM